MSKSFRPAIRDAVVLAAIELWTECPSASLGDIAIRAGVGRASLHRYFEGRAHLAKIVVERCMNDIETATMEGVSSAESPQERLFLMLKALIPLGDRYHFVATVKIDDQYIQARHAAETRWIDSLIDELKRDAIIDPLLSNQWIIAVIEAQIFLAWRYFIKDAVLSVHDVATLCLRTVLRGIVAQSDRNMSLGI